MLIHAWVIPIVNVSVNSWILIIWAYSLTILLCFLFFCLLLLLFLFLFLLWALWWLARIYTLFIIFYELLGSPNSLHPLYLFYFLFLFLFPFFLLFFNNGYISKMAASINSPISLIDIIKIILSLFF